MSLLANYYAAQQQELAARSGLADAQRLGVLNQNREIADNDASKRALEGAQTGSLGATAANTAAQTKEVAANAASGRAVQGATAGLTGVQTAIDYAKLPFAGAGAAADIAGKVAQTAGQNLSNTYYGQVQDSALATQGAQRNIINQDASAIPGSVGAAIGAMGTNAGSLLPGGRPVYRPGMSVLGLAKGGIVPKSAPAKPQKIAKSDTVPAMLTPGEGVLNKGAVEHYGTDLVHHMNKMGLMRLAAKGEHQKMMQTGKRPKMAKVPKGAHKPTVNAFHAAVEVHRHTLAHHLKLG